MKHLFTLLIGLSLGHSATAQYFDSLQQAPIGSQRTYFVCDSAAPSMAQQYGPNSYWDYSFVSGYGTQTRTITMLVPGSTQYSAEFPNANKVFAIEGYLMNYQTLSSGGLHSAGFVLPNTDLGDVRAKFPSNDEHLMNFPFNQYDSLVDAFTGNIAFNYNGTNQNPSCYGGSLTHFDGWGTMVLPDGTIQSNVSRLKVMDTVYATVNILGEVRLVREQYEYYNLNGSDSLPIFVHSHAFVLSGFPSPLIDITLVLSSSQPSGQAALSEDFFTGLKIYPNPSQGTVNIQGADQANIRIVDLTGKLIQEIPSSLSAQTIQLPSGIYLAEISKNGHKTSRRIVCL